MFERYTEKARRVIFFARYEASQFGQPFIETEHILLGLLREDKGLTNRFLHTYGGVEEAIRMEIAKHTVIREKTSTSIDLPLSNESKRVLAYAAEEAEHLGHKHVGTEHLLLGLLREEDCLAVQILKERGITLEAARAQIAKTSTEQTLAGRSPMRQGVESLTGIYSDLTLKASEGELQPVVARDLEVESVMEVLCRRERRNPMLLGERGVGKTAIVQALAQRIADGKVPAALASMRVLAISAEVLAGWIPSRERFEDLARVLDMVSNSARTILFVDGLHGAMDKSGKATRPDFAGVLKFAMQEAELRCVGATTEEDYKSICEKYPGLEKAFRPLHVRPIGAAESRQVLEARKEGLQRFHEVAFADDALACAIERADSYLNDKLLPGKALEVLDAAAAAIKVRRDAEPSELSESKKKIAFIGERLASAIANHEFEKARFYSDEERKERETLAALQETYGIDATSAPTVTREDVEKIIAKWKAYPYSQ